jgi:hypothetical protein
LIGTTFVSFFVNPQLFVIIQRVFDQPSKKRKQQQRKDARMNGIIIRENVSDVIRKLQPKDVPFPFTRIQDFETYIQQPLGRDWNTPIACQKLTQPSLLTKVTIFLIRQIFNNNANFSSPDELYDHWTKRLKCKERNWQR